MPGGIAVLMVAFTWATSAVASATEDQLLWDAVLIQDIENAKLALKRGANANARPSATRRMTVLEAASWGTWRQAYSCQGTKPTHASFGAGGGLGLPIIGRLLGHAHAATTARYAHLDNDPLRRASEAIAARIAAALKTQRAISDSRSAPY